MSIRRTTAAALEQLGSTTGVNLLLTDVVLPGGMNGRELATEVERRAPGTQVLYMSGYTEDAIVHHGRLDADAALLQKPFRRADLARVVRRVLDGPSAELTELWPRVSSTSAVGQQRKSSGGHGKVCSQA